MTKANNHFNNILRPFDVLPNFPFTTSETMRDYYLRTWYIRVTSRAAQQFAIESLEIHQMITQCPAPPPK